MILLTVHQAQSNLLNHTLKPDLKGEYAYWSQLIVWIVFEEKLKCFKETIGGFLPQFTVS